MIKLNIFDVASISEVIEIINDKFEYSLPSEKVGLLECHGRILHDDVISGVNIPDFKRSTVDGYAVRSRDLFGASETSPSMLDLIGEAEMGKTNLCSLEFPGECVYVPTGGMLPEGSDAVIMIENVEQLDEITLLANKSVAPGENVIQIGEDIGEGELVLRKGVGLRPYEIGVLASIGCTSVIVTRKPKIGIISTGDEIVEPGKVPALGQVRDINSYLLYSLIQESSGEPVMYDFVRDDFDELRETVGSALCECDTVLISGGSSVGKKDETMNVINSFENSEILVHGIAIKPGKPTILGKAGGKAVFGLPGHPLACAVIYKAFVTRYINKLTGKVEADYPVECEFEINYHKAKGREEYLPVAIRQEGDARIATPILSKSGLITGFSKAWGYVKIEKNNEGLRKGQAVQVYKF
ncbi:MAG TPA: gephyrin-like molybdotransferase Glp [Clostridiaceae bacterium]